MVFDNGDLQSLLKLLGAEVFKCMDVDPKDISVGTWNDEMLPEIT